MSIRKGISRIIHSEKHFSKPLPIQPGTFGTLYLCTALFAGFQPDARISQVRIVVSDAKKVNNIRRF